MRTRDILAANLSALMADPKRAHLATLKKITDASGGSLSNGKLDRVRRATHATDIDTVGELAKVFRLEPWQLLVPGLNPEALPQLVNAELLKSLQALLASQAHQQAAEGTGTTTDTTGQLSSTTGVPHRLPGEKSRTGEARSTREVDRSGAVPSKRSRRRS